MTPTITRSEDLVARCRKGDQRAQLEMYNKYYKAMYNTALRIVKDPAEAEDVMQEAFIKAFSKINSFQGKSTFGAWLKKITVNLSINSFHKSNKYQQVSYENEFRHKVEESDYEGITIQEGEINSQVQKVLTALNSLKESYRIVLTLHLIEGYDYDEICEILGWSSANCRTSISRAKESLRKKLMENEK